MGTRAWGAALLWAALGFGGCYSELGSPLCFADPVLLNAQGDTTACCTPGNEGDRACGDFYRAEGTLAHMAPLAICTEAGVCALDCRAGENCECVLGAACGQGSQCQIVDQAEEVCARHGQMGGARCSICTECGDDAGCVDHEAGAQCLGTALAPALYCGCEADADCSDGKTCTEGGCQ